MKAELVDRAIKIGKALTAEEGGLAQAVRSLAYGPESRLFAGAPGSEVQQATERVARISGLSRSDQQIASDSERVALSIVEQQPQVTPSGKLDWIFGGSIVPNILKTKNSVNVLKGSKIPDITSSHSLELSDEARQRLQVRKIGDVDIFLATDGQQERLYPIFKKLDYLPADAADAFKEPDKLSLQILPFRLYVPEVVSVQAHGKEIFMAGPKQLLTDKMVHALTLYGSGGETAKFTNDFSALLDASSAIYPRAELFSFAKTALIREQVRGRRLYMLPDESAGATRVNDFVRELLQEYPPSGGFLKDMKIASGQSLHALNMLDRIPAAADKSAIVGFWNRHQEKLARFDVSGTPENTTWMTHRHLGTAPDALLGTLEKLDPLRVTQELGQLDQYLDKYNNLTAVEHVFFFNSNPADRMRFFDATRNAPKGLSQAQAEQFVADLEFTTFSPTKMQAVINKHAAIAAHGAAE